MGKETNEESFYGKAEEYFQSALKYATNYQRGIVYNNTALIYQEKNQHNIALNLFGKAESFLKGTKKRIAELRNGQALSYLSLGEYDCSIKALNEAFLIFTELMTK